MVKGGRLIGNDTSINWIDWTFVIASGNFTAKLFSLGHLVISLSSEWIEIFFFPKTYSLPGGIIDD